MSYNISTGIYENEFELNSLITNNANAIQLIEIVNNEQQITIDNSVSDILDIETCNVIQQGLITSLQSEILDVQTCNVNQQNFIDAFNSDLTDIKTCNVIQQGLITTLQTDFSNINYDIDLLTTDDILEGTNKYSQWTETGNNIYYNDGNVGIGIASPLHKLHLVGNTCMKVGNRSEVYFEDNNYDNADGGGITLRTSLNPTNGSIFAVRSSGQAARLWVGQDLTSVAYNDFCAGYIGTNGLEATISRYNFIVKYATGSVGIGITDPQHKLDVVGDANITGTYKINGTPIDTDVIGQGTTNLYSQWTTAGNVIYYNNGNVGIGTTVPDSILHLSKKNSVEGTTPNTFTGYHNLTEYLRFVSKGDPQDVNAISVGFKLGQDSTTNASPNGRVDICANQNANANNDYGGIPNKTIASFIGNGNVGIGTTDPITNLHVKEKAYIGNDVSGSLGPPTISVLGGQGSRLILFKGTTTKVPYSIGVENYTLWYASPFTHKWYNNTNISMTLNENGNLGIGTSDPKTILNIVKAGDPRLRITGIDDNDTAGIQLLENTNDSTTFGTELVYDGINNKFNINMFAGNINTRLTILRANGNVGIGSTNPQAKLHCQGTILTATDGDNFNNEKTNIYFCRADRPTPLNDRHHYITSKTNGSGLSNDNFINFYIDDGTTANGTSHNKTLSITGTGVDISGSLTLSGPIYNEYQSRSLGVGTKWIRIGEYYERCNCKFTVHYAGVGVHDLLEIEVKWRFGATTKGECLIFKTCNSYVGTSDYFSNIYIQNFETSYSNRRYIWVKYTTTINTSITLYAHLERYDQFSDQEAKLNDLSTVSQLTPTGGTNFTIKDGVIQTVNYNHEISDGNLTISGNVGIGTTAPSCSLTINTEAVHKNSYNHSEAQLLLTHTATRTSSTTLNDPKKILHLSREGTSSQSYAAKASFSLSRYENNSTNSRTRLDLTLAHESYDDVNVLTVLSSGNVGIGKTNPTSKLHVYGDILSDWGSGKTVQLATPGGQPGFIICGNATDSYSRFDISNHAVGTTGNRYFRMGFNGDTFPLVIRKGGNVGIGTTTPSAKLHVNGNVRCDGAITLGIGFTRHLQIGKWYIYQASAAYSGDPYGDLDQNDLVFSYRATGTNIQDEGLGWVQYNDRNIDFIDYTGQHRAVSKNKNLYDTKYVGYIISSTGLFKDLNSKYKNQNRNTNINSALPYVDLSNKVQDKACFGVLSDSEEDNKRTYHSAGVFKSSYKMNKGDKRIIINSLGEGSIWISNYNGNIGNGDYITTSPIPGIGMRQNSDSLKNYSVAKATCSVDFNNIQSYPLEKVKQEYIYTSNIKAVESNIEIIEPLSNLAYYSNVDENSNMVITSNYEFSSNVIKTETINVSNLVINSNLENCLDSNGDLIYEIQYDENSNIIYESEYEIKYIDIQGNILDIDQYDSNIHYIMCFIGCTYHCG
jgi:hypothetical protein